MGTSGIPMLSRKNWIPCSPSPGRQMIFPFLDINPKDSDMQSVSPNQAALDSLETARAELLAQVADLDDRIDAVRAIRYPALLPFETSPPQGFVPATCQCGMPTFTRPFAVNVIDHRPDAVVRCPGCAIRAAAAKLSSEGSVIRGPMALPEECLSDLKFDLGEIRLAKTLSQATDYRLSIIDALVNHGKRPAPPAGHSIVSSVEILSDTPRVMVTGVPSSARRIPFGSPVSIWTVTSRFDRYGTEIPAMTLVTIPGPTCQHTRSEF